MEKDKVKSAKEAIFEDIIADSKGILDSLYEIMDANFLKEDYDVVIERDSFDDSLIRNTIYIYKNVEENKFIIDYNSLSEEDKKHLKSKNILELNATVIELVKKDSLEKYENIINFFKQTINIIVIFRMKNVTITNERGENHLIPSIFARFRLNLGGVLIDRFRICRNEFTFKEAVVNYIHSHVSCGYMNIEEPVVKWGDPCLGNGPIRRSKDMFYTIPSYNVDEFYPAMSLYLNDIMEFMKVESLTGIPYIYLNKIKQVDTSGNGYRIIECYKLYNYIHGNIDYYFDKLKAHNYNYNVTKDIRSFVTGFIKDFLSNPSIEYKYVDNIISPAYSKIDFVKLLTTRFKEYYNKCKATNTLPKGFRIKNLMKCSILLEGEYIDGGINYHIKGNSNRDSRVNNAIERIGKNTGIVFKGETLKFNIIDYIDNSSKEEISIFEKETYLDDLLVDYIYSLIINIINL